MASRPILKGVTVLEMAGLAPVQFCSQVLLDFGARVVRIDKVKNTSPQEELHGNGKLSVALNLKTADGINALKRLSLVADVIVDPYRAGVMEKLGLGPEILQKENKRLIYARLSGYGQSGKYSQYAGHDINFLSLSGVLSLLGWRNKAPEPPCNLLGDFGGGGLLCALGIVLALYERERSGQGQVVDHSITRGSSYLASWILSTKSLLLSAPRGHNLLDGGYYGYDVYETKDGKWMTVGAIEKKFYEQLLIGLDLSPEECPQFCASGRELFTRKFRERTQAEWTEIFKNLDACVTPVLTVDEAREDREADFALTGEGGEVVGQVEPRFSRSGGRTSLCLPPPRHGQHTAELLAEAGYTSSEIQQLVHSRAVYVPTTLAKL